MQQLKTITYITWSQSSGQIVAVAGETVTINSDQAANLVAIGRAIYAGQPLPAPQTISITVQQDQLFARNP